MTNLFKSLMLALTAASLLAPAALVALPPGSGADSGAGYWVPNPSASSVSRSQQAPATPDTSRSAAGRVPLNSDDHLLMPGDLIQVKVFQEPDMDSSLRVAKDGMVVVPLIDRVKVGGLTPQAAASVIRDLLNKDYLVNPQVSLLVMEYSRRSFTVLGEVQKPGSYDMPDRASVSLLEAIGISGGYTRVANPSNVTVKRKVNNQETIIHLDAKKMAAGGGSTTSFEVQPDDVITVAESIF